MKRFSLIMLLILCYLTQGTAIAEMIVEPSDLDLALEIAYPIAEEKALELLGQRRTETKYQMI